MDKKILTIVLLGVLLSIPLIVSIPQVPQFLLFKGDVKIDGRIASEGTLVNFSVNGTELAHVAVDSNSEYGVFIQGHPELYNQPINITVGDYKAEQEIDYVYPQDVFFNLSTLTEKALNVTEVFPSKSEVRVSHTGVQDFNISTYTGYNDSVNHTWFLDGKEAKSFSDINSSSFEYMVLNNDSGTHRIEIFATDGFLTVSEEWILIIERPETSGFDGNTTDLDSLDLNELGDIPNVILEKTGKGKIEFLENLNLTGVTNLNEKVKINKGVVAINSSFYPQLSKPARITLTGLNYNTIPKIFYNNEFTVNPFSINKECDFCNILNYTPNPTTNGVVVFEVEHFSSFRVGESGERYNLTLFDDLDTCKEGTIGDLYLTIQDPDNGDEFKPGEEIEIEVDVENTADDDKDIVMEVALYNIDEDEVIEELEDEKEIDGGEDETFEFVMEVPNDFEDGSYLVFVKAYEDGDEKIQCVEDAIEIDLEREKHSVVIKDFSINPETITTGKNISIFAEVWNVGKNDEDVYIVAGIEKLDVSTKSDVFELEEFGDDDTYSETLFLEIPSGTQEGNYTLNIKAVFDGEKDEKTATVFVTKSVPIIFEPIVLSTEKTEKLEKTIPFKPDEKKYPEIQKPSKFPVWIPIVLFIGIIILIILIVTIGLKRR